MKGRAKSGGYGPAQKEGKKKRRKDTPPLMPLDYALTRMRDESLAPELRDSMAKAAMPFTHGRRPLEQPPAPTPQADAMQWSDLELARRIQHILMLADMEQEEKNKSAEEGARSDRREDIQENAREQNQAVAPSPVTHLAPDEPAPGFVRFSSHAPEPVLPDEVLPDPDEVLPDEEQPRFDPLDPHPGYRWIR